MNTKIYLDLVDEAMFEDIEEIFCTLEEAGLESLDYDTVQAAQLTYYIEEDNATLY